MSKKSKAKVQSINFPEALLNKAKRKAERHNRSLSNYVVRLVAADLEAS